MKNTATGVRAEWDAYDLTSKSGIAVEIKSAAYLQSWFQEKLSDIGFSISKSREWNSATNKLSSESKRQADVYVFCLLEHKNKATVNPMDLNQWCFYILSTKILNTECKSLKKLSLKKLLSLSPIPAKFGGISKAIESMVNDS